ncbi:MAG: Sec-independent protein translocase protein TatB [Pseudomonadota bacterium]
MFDIGFLELVIVSVVGLLVLGPERLPVAIRTVSLYVGKVRNSIASVRADIERELKADEIRQELHNQTVMQELRSAEKSLRASLEQESGMRIGKDGYPVDTSAEELTAATVRSHSGNTTDLEAATPGTTNESAEPAADKDIDDGLAEASKHMGTADSDTEAMRESGSS